MLSFMTHFPYTPSSPPKDNQSNPQSISTGNLGNWASKTRLTLLEEINKFLQKFKDTGGFEKLGKKFLPDEKAYFKAHNIPFYF